MHVIGLLHPWSRGSLERNTCISLFPNSRPKTQIAVIIRSRGRYTVSPLMEIESRREGKWIPMSKSNIRKLTDPIFIYTLCPSSLTSLNVSLFEPIWLWNTRISIPCNKWATPFPTLGSWINEYKRFRNCHVVRLSIYQVLHATMHMSDISINLS